MRIVAGHLKGRRLEAPMGRDLRPTSDRAREGLFNRLSHGNFGPGGASILAGATVLDAYCGTGALGLEALSRGAATVTFLDADRGALNAARANAHRLEVVAQCRFVQADATLPPRARQTHTLIFLDPPYSSGEAGAAITALARHGWIAPGALVAVETDARAGGPGAPPGFELISGARYGAARMTLMRDQAKPEDQGPSS
jgi:16S rRNA (guanine966-N2)-methyltransferase